MHFTIYSEINTCMNTVHTVRLFGTHWYTQNDLLSSPKESTSRRNLILKDVCHNVGKMSENSHWGKCVKINNTNWERLYDYNERNGLKHLLYLVFQLIWNVTKEL